MKLPSNTKKIFPILIGNWNTPIKKHFRFVFILAAVFALFPSLSFASCQRPALLSLGVGSFDTLRPNRRMLQFQIEYKWSADWNGIQPFVCAMATQKGSLYFCFGGCYDFFMKKYFVLTLAFAPGIYFKNHGKDLGFPLEFRSSIAFAFEFPNKDRLGMQFYHISNASLGRTIGNKNPGEESLVIFYGIAF